MGIGDGYSTVDEKLDGFKGACFGTHVAGVADVVTSNGDASVVLFCFVGVDLAYDPGVGDVTPVVLGEHGSEWAGRYLCP